MCEQTSSSGRPRHELHHLSDSLRWTMITDLMRRAHVKSWRWQPVTHFNSQTTVLRSVKPTLCNNSQQQWLFSPSSIHISQEDEKTVTCFGFQLAALCEASLQTLSQHTCTQVRWTHGLLHRGIYICATSSFIKSSADLLTDMFPLYFLSNVVSYSNQGGPDLLRIRVWKKNSVYFTVLQLHSWPDEILRYIFI